MNINANYTYGSYYNQTQRRREKSVTTAIDQDEDKTLSAEELSGFTEEYSKRTGTELDITSLMETYDNDGDGALNESEQEAMNGDKALEQLLFPVNHKMFRNFRMGPPPTESAANDLTVGATEASETGASSVTSESTESEADKFAAMRETLKEIYAQIDEALAKKEEELRAIEETGEEDQLTQMLFQRLAGRAAGTYEQNFWFENNLTDLFQANA